MASTDEMNSIVNTNNFLSANNFSLYNESNDHHSHHQAQHHHHQQSSTNNKQHERISDDDESDLVDDFVYFEPKWTVPRIHPAADAPMCDSCKQLDTTFFNINCQDCLTLIRQPDTTISQLFAVIRQWVPQTQQCIETLVREILKRGANVDDRDGLNDFSLLMYAAKSGSPGVGDEDVALKTVHLLVSNGANTTLRCRWTDMNAIHYAVYFEVASVVDYLLTVTDRALIDDVCQDFDGGSSLHVAAANMCLDSLKVLLSHGADVLLKNDQGRTPMECVPDAHSIDENEPTTKAGAEEIIREMRSVLESATDACIPGSMINQMPVTGKVVLQALGLQIGDRIFINGCKEGILRFCGATSFAPGQIWAGIELAEPDGKNDGRIQGIEYFRCAPNHGIFAPINRISKFGRKLKVCKGMSPLVQRVNYPGVNVSHVSPKVETGLSSIKNKSYQNFEAMVGDRIMLIDKRRGVIRYAGETQFAAGYWLGIELDEAGGKNDGSVNGHRYFQCGNNHGLFAPLSRVAKILKPKFEWKESDEDSDVSLAMSAEAGRSPINTPRFKRRALIENTRPRSSPVHGTSKLATSSNSPESWLTVGVNVLVNNEIGVVRYIGPVEFSEGTWLGIELRSSNGKNDGSVQNKRYFSCKPQHGLLVKPKKVSVRGINGAKLLPTESSSLTALI